jgi:hypothetical protein
MNAPPKEGDVLNRLKPLVGPLPEWAGEEMEATGLSFWHLVMLLAKGELPPIMHRKVNPENTLAVGKGMLGLTSVLREWLPGLERSAHGLVQRAEGRGEGEDGLVP